MTEKRIKGTFISKHREDVDSYHWVIEVPAADFNVANCGTPVEIVYCEEVEIRQGQKWRIAGDLSVVVACYRGAWCIVDNNGAFIPHKSGAWWPEPELQAWLNEHATLVTEGES